MSLVTEDANPQRERIVNVPAEERITGKSGALMHKWTSCLRNRRTVYTIPGYAIYASPFGKGWDLYSDNGQETKGFIGDFFSLEEAKSRAENPPR